MESLGLVPVISFQNPNYPHDAVFETPSAHGKAWLAMTAAHIPHCRLNPVWTSTGPSPKYIVVTTESVMAEGDTREEALQKLRAAIQSSILGLREVQAGELDV